MNGPLKYLTARKIYECSLARAPQIFALLVSSQSKFFISARAHKKNRSARHARKCSQRPFITPNCHCQYYYPVYLSVIIFVTILLSFVVVLCGTCFILFFFFLGGGGGVAQNFGVFVRTVLWPLAPYFFSQVTRKS